MLLSLKHIHHFGNSPHLLLLRIKQKLLIISALQNIRCKNSSVLKLIRRSVRIQFIYFPLANIRIIFISTKFLGKKITRKRATGITACGPFCDLDAVCQVPPNQRERGAMYLSPGTCTCPLARGAPLPSLEVNPGRIIISPYCRKTVVNNKFLTKGRNLSVPTNSKDLPFNLKSL